MTTDSDMIMGLKMQRVNSVCRLIRPSMVSNRLNLLSRHLVYGKRLTRMFTWLRYYNLDKWVKCVQHLKGGLKLLYIPQTNCLLKVQLVWFYSYKPMKS